MADALDFSKIWGTNGNITYDFTDDNYLKGWNFIGSVPPARGMFDKLQQLGDMKDQYLYNQLKELTTKQYTVDDTLKPTANEAVLATLLSNLANMVKQNKGTDDWKTTPPTNLTTLATLAGNLASGSDVTWEGNKFTNAKLGITGLMEQNGYICFGKNFGGLILQWGKGQGIEVKYTYPLAMMQFLTAAVVHLDNSQDVYHDRLTMFQIHVPSNTSLTVVSQITSGSPEFLVLIIGR